MAESSGCKSPKRWLKWWCRLEKHEGREAAIYRFRVVGIATGGGPAIQWGVGRCLGETPGDGRDTTGGR
ncbi:hypothetical protein WN944_026685 [Citrus x changshan-huyou]|uniref:Uncharacterized protein n=1 Tax=Citrus x changshan-huyou TaxID=2935761 RepID=A0AAP0QHV3_9ROSI